MRWKSTHSPEEQSDISLARAVVDGSAEAADHFFEHYAPRVYRFALAQVAYNHDLAEEVTQTTLCRAVSRLRVYRGEASLFTYLCAICRNELASLSRGSRRMEFVALEGRREMELDLGSLSSPSAGPFGDLAQKELGERVRIVLDFLPRRQARALEWKYFEDVTAKEIGCRLAISVKAAEALLVRARRTFAKEFSAVVGLDDLREYVR